MLPKGGICLTFLCKCCWIHINRIPIPMGHGPKTNANAYAKSNPKWKKRINGFLKPFYPVLCPDHLWEWGWCWVGRCGRDGPSANETWGDILTGSQSSWPQEGFPQGQGREKEEGGDGQVSPSPPSHYPAVTSSVFLSQHKESAASSSSLWNRTQKRTDENEIYKLIHTHKNTHTQRTCWQIPDASHAQPLEGVLPCKCTRLGWALLVNQSLMMH